MRIGGSGGLPWRNPESYRQRRRRAWAQRSAEHPAQEEWFYCLEGPFLIEVGQERFPLGPGDSVLAPRKIPHVWALVGNKPGKLLIAFTPAGKMEAFFQEMTKANAMPPQDPELWRAHGMELLAPTLGLWLREVPVHHDEL